MGHFHTTRDDYELLSQSPATMIACTAPNLQIVHLTQAIPASDIAQLLRSSLQNQPRTIPCQFFYDDRGSDLFEKICTLPEYYLTRTEAQILTASAPEIARITQATQIVELGSGSSTKTRLLLNAFPKPLTYVPIDISGAILTHTARQLMQEYKNLSIYGMVATYETALSQLPPTTGSRLLCFLGSTLGNFTPSQTELFFSQVTGAMDKGDYFLLGVDCHKDTHILESAYNDHYGVTAEFNKNMLLHLNRRFGANFVPDYFRHSAIYNLQEQQIEMYLISERTQTITIPAIDVNFTLTAGEALLTEISRKFMPLQLKQTLSRHGLETVSIFHDRHHWLTVFLCQWTGG